MEFNEHILEYLKKNDSVEVLGFGIFRLKEGSAILDENSGTILPPAAEIFFEEDQLVLGNDFINYLSDKEKMPKQDMRYEVLKIVDHWKELINDTDHLKLNDIGVFNVKDKTLSFKGERINLSDPVFFGLDVVDLKKNKTIKKQENLVWFWIFLFLIPTLGIAYFAVTQPNFVFGKDSFTKGNTILIDKNTVAPNTKDSLKTQTQKNPIPVVAKTPVVEKAPIKETTTNANNPKETKSLDKDGKQISTNTPAKGKVESKDQAKIKENNSTSTKEKPLNKDKSNINNKTQTKEKASSKNKTPAKSVLTKKRTDIKNQSQKSDKSKKSKVERN